MNLEKVLAAYIECALWSSLDDNGMPLDKNYNRTDITDEALTSMESDCADFIRCNALLLNSLSEEQVGHDFWLTRNHHGAGFWDRGLGKVGDELTAHAHAYGESELYIGDDGSLHVT